jgi:hypothetical protein
MSEQDEIARLLEIAAKGQEEKKELSEVEEFFIKFEVVPADYAKTPTWALYRAYRLWSKKPLTLHQFCVEVRKKFKSVKTAYRTPKFKSYFLSSDKVDISDAAYYEEQAWEKHQKSAKEKAKKEKYKDKPYVKDRFKKLHERAAKEKAERAKKKVN